MPSFKIIGLLVLEKILKVFTIYGNGGHLGHVTLTIYILGKKSNGPPAINFPNSRTAGRIFIIYTSF